MPLHACRGESHGERALEVIESTRRGSTSQQLRASYLATAQDVYRFYVDLLVQAADTWHVVAWAAVPIATTSSISWCRFAVRGG